MAYLKKMSSATWSSSAVDRLAAIAFLQLAIPQLGPAMRQAGQTLRQTAARAHQSGRGESASLPSRPRPCTWP